MRIATGFILFCLALPGAACAQDGEVARYGYEIVARYPHDRSAYTQGLFFADGQLYESTGQVGASSIRRVDLESGEVQAMTPIRPPAFGEGATLHDGQIYMVTWRLGSGYIFDPDTLTQTGGFSIFGEGWGLTSDGERLILSDGGAALRFLDPATGQDVDRVTVRMDGARIDQLNELEFINGEVWANVYGSTDIVRIDPDSGEVTGVIDLAGLRREAGVRADFDHALNGIAWDAEGERLFVTGKLWPELYEIRLVEE